MIIPAAQSARRVSYFRGPKTAPSATREREATAPAPIPDRHLRQIDLDTNAARPLMQVDLDFKQFRDKARQMGIFADDQLPFAIANTLNLAMLGPGGAREHIVSKTFPRSFDVRNRSFARAAFIVKTANKGDLSVELFDRLKRGHLEKHAGGGTKQARGSLALPNWRGRIKRTAGGSVPRPKAIKVPNPRRALRVVKGKGIFVGEGGRLHALYWFRKQGRLNKRFPFYEEFAAVAKRQVEHHFPAQIQRAINTAFSR